MKGDFTRDTFNPKKHFSRVLMQQGRVQLDADWNEQAAILLHYLQSLAADLIGSHGGPGGGFQIDAQLEGSNVVDLMIKPGHYYVEGILCELEATPVPIIEFPVDTDTKKARVSTLVVDGRTFEPRQWVEIGNQFFKITDVEVSQRVLTFRTAITTTSPAQLRRITTYYTQPDYPRDTTRDPLPRLPFLVYLDVWERHITYIEDFQFPSIREIALGGPDTASRAKVLWQVKTQLLTSGTNCNNMVLSWTNLIEQWQPKNRGQLKAKTKEPTTKNTDACTISPEARFRGPENQLYRVEIHAGGAAGTAKFKWSRDNGSVVYPVRKLQGNVVTLEHLGQDDRRSLHVSQWVEIIDDNMTLRGEAGPFLQIEIIDEVEKTVTLTVPTGVTLPVYNEDDPRHPLLRRWDSGLIPVREGTAEQDWIDLEDGIVIQFQPVPSPPIAHTYRPGDYWLIPARTAVGEVLWPYEKDADDKKQPLALPPHGVEHHFAPLALVSVGTGGTITASDCRNCFDPISAFPCTGTGTAGAVVNTVAATEPASKTSPRTRAKPRTDSDDHQ